MIRHENLETNGEWLKRCSHSADIYQDKMYVFGGRCEEDPWEANNELWALDLSTKKNKFLILCFRGFNMEIL